MTDAAKLAEAVAAAFNLFGLAASPEGLRYLRSHNADAALKTGIQDAAQTCLDLFAKAWSVPPSVDLPKLKSLLTELLASPSLLDFQDAEQARKLNDLMRKVIESMGIPLPPPE